jgi:hypothetical protein
MQQFYLSGPVTDPIELRVDGKYNNLDDEKKKVILERYAFSLVPYESSQIQDRCIFYTLLYNLLFVLPVRLSTLPSVEEKLSYKLSSLFLSEQKSMDIIMDFFNEHKIDDLSYHFSDLNKEQVIISFSEKINHKVKNP